MTINNVPITPGAGAMIATDEVTVSGSLINVQYLKLMDGRDSGSEVASVDGTYGLAVDIKRIPAIDLVIGGSITNIYANIIPVGLFAGDSNYYSFRVDNEMNLLTKSYIAEDQQIQSFLFAYDDSIGDYLQLKVDSGGRLYTNSIISGSILSSIYSGSVSITNSLPAGTNAIGKLVANNGVDVGDITINNSASAGVYIQPGTSVNLNTSNIAGSIVLLTGANTIGKLATNNAVDIGDVTINNSASAGVYIKPGTGTNLNTSNIAGSIVLLTGTAAIGKLAANSGIDIGDVTINNSASAGVYVRNDAGNSIYTQNTSDSPIYIRPQNTSGTFFNTKSWRDFLITTASGVGNINATINNTAFHTRLVSLLLHLSGSPTNTNSFILYLDSSSGSYFDTVLLSQSLYGITDLFYQPDTDFFIRDTDSLIATYTNSGSLTYGLTANLEVISATTLGG